MYKYTISTAPGTPADANGSVGKLIVSRTAVLDRAALGPIPAGSRETWRRTLAWLASNDPRCPGCYRQQSRTLSPEAAVISFEPIARTTLGITSTPTAKHIYCRACGCSLVRIRYLLADRTPTYLIAGDFVLPEGWI